MIFPQAAQEIPSPLIAADLVVFLDYIAHNRCVSLQRKSRSCLGNAAIYKPYPQCWKGFAIYRRNTLGRCEELNGLFICAIQFTELFDVEEVTT